MCLDAQIVDKARDDHQGNNEKSTATNLDELLSNLKNLQRNKAIRSLKLLEETFDE